VRRKDHSTSDLRKLFNRALTAAAPRETRAATAPQIMASAIIGQT